MCLHIKQLNIRLFILYECLNTSNGLIAELFLRSLSYILCHKTLSHSLLLNMSLSITAKLQCRYLNVYILAYHTT